MLRSRNLNSLGNLNQKIEFNSEQIESFLMLTFVAVTKQEKLHKFQRLRNSNSH